MAGTVSTDITTIHNCDSVGSWTGSPTLDIEVYAEGSGSLSAKVSKSTATFTYPLGAVTDYSGKVIFCKDFCIKEFKCTPSLYRSRELSCIERRKC